MYSKYRIGDPQFPQMGIVDPGILRRPLPRRGAGREPGIDDCPGPGIVEVE